LVYGSLGLAAPDIAADGAEHFDGNLLLQEDLKIE
jgi:hypothetical protein